MQYSVCLTAKYRVKLTPGPLKKGKVCVLVVCKLLLCKAPAKCVVSHDVRDKNK